MCWASNNTMRIAIMTFGLFDLAANCLLKLYQLINESHTHYCVSAVQRMWSPITILSAANTIRITKIS